MYVAIAIASEVIVKTVLIVMNMNILLGLGTNKAPQTLGDSKKKKRFFFGRQGKPVEHCGAGSLNQAITMGTIVESDSEIHVELPSDDNSACIRHPPSPASVTLTPTARVRVRHLFAKAVSPEEVPDDFPVQFSIIESENNIEILAEDKQSASQNSSPSLSHHCKTKGKGVGTCPIAEDPDDVSVFIVHQYFDGEITSIPSVVDDSLEIASLTTGTSSEHPTDISPGQFSLLDEFERDYFPTEIRPNANVVDNSLLDDDDDDDISAISIDRELKFQGMKVDELVDNAAVAPEDERKRISLAKLRMIQNKHSVRCGRRVRICETRVTEDDDDSTFATLDEVEWDDEIGAEFCSGETVYDLLGTPEDYPLTRNLVSTCDGHNEEVKRSR